MLSNFFSFNYAQQCGPGERDAGNYQVFCT